MAMSTPRSSRHALFAACVATGALCGASAAMAHAGTPHTATAVIHDCDGDSATKPGNFRIQCNDPNTTLTNLRWKKWGAKRAHGTGNMVDDSDRSVRVRITLAAQSNSEDGRYYRRMVVRVVGPAKGLKRRYIYNLSPENAPKPFAPKAKRRGAPTVMHDCDGDSAAKPRSFRIQCNDPNTALTNLRWKKWGTKRAHGTGNMVDDSDRSVRVRVALSGRTAGATRHYRRMVVRVVGNPQGLKRRYIYKLSPNAAPRLVK